MEVLPINNFYTKPQNINRDNYTGRLYPKLKYDTFCFRGQNFLELPPKEIYQKVINSMIPENFVGQGTEGEVYRIKDTEYCVKIPYEVVGLYSKKINLDKTLYLNKKISPKQKVNHVFIELNGNATIMKFFEGKIPKDYFSNKENRYLLQSEIAQMPVKSYTNLLHQIANGIDNEMLFDNTIGNLIVNTKENKLTAIDFFPIIENPREVRPLNEIYSLLTAYGAEQKTGKKIFDNIMNAGLDEFEPQKVPCMDTELFDFTELCQRRIEDTKIQGSEKIMDKISQQILTLKGLKKVEYTEPLFSTFIKEKIDIVKDLIKYLK